MASESLQASLLACSYHDQPWGSTSARVHAAVWAPIEPSVAPQSRAGAQPAPYTAGYAGAQPAPSPVDYAPGFIPFPPCRGIYGWVFGQTVRHGAPSHGDSVLPNNVGATNGSSAPRCATRRYPDCVTTSAPLAAAAPIHAARRREDSITLGLANVLDVVPVRSAPAEEARRDVGAPDQPAVTLLRHAATGSMWCATDADRGWSLVSERYFRSQLPPDRPRLISQPRVDAPPGAWPAYDNALALPRKTWGGKHAVRTRLF